MRWGQRPVTGLLQDHIGQRSAGSKKPAALRFRFSPIEVVGASGRKGASVFKLRQGSRELRGAL